MRLSYSSYRNFRVTLAAVHKKICMDEENSMDILSGFIQGAIPGIISNDRERSTYQGRLAPRGFRGYSTTGAATAGYCSSQHIEAATDPDWTMGMCFDSGDAGPGAYNFSLSCANGGRGLIARNTIGTISIWQGKKNLHGTTVDHTTEAIDQGKRRPTVGIATYLKTPAINMGHRLAAAPLKTFKMVRGGGDLSQEYQAGSPGWFFPF